jgi:hypothetical protein
MFSLNLSNVKVIKFIHKTWPTDSPVATKTVDPYADTCDVNDASKYWYASSAVK